jgi:hypothetical protein
MKTDICTLIVVDMHGYLGSRLQGFAGSKLVALKVGPNHVIGVADGHALREFAGVVGIEFPAGFAGLIGRPADFHLDTVKGMAVGIPNRPEDKSVGLRLVGGARPRAYGGWRRGQTQHCQSQ